jgi:hypothetical protein
MHDLFRAGLSDESDSRADFQSIRRYCLASKVNRCLTSTRAHRRSTIGDDGQEYKAFTRSMAMHQDVVTQRVVTASSLAVLPRSNTA